MVERIAGVDRGVLGFRLPGKVTRDEYQEQLMRPILEALERGEQLNLLIEMTGDLIRHGVSAFESLSPGELRVFEPLERDAAAAWVSAAAAYQRTVQPPSITRVPRDRRGRTVLRSCKEHPPTFAEGCGRRRSGAGVDTSLEENADATVLG